MVHRNISDIELPFFIWKTVKPIKTIFPNVALDTETRDGRCFLISDSNRRSVYIDNLYDLLTYLNTKDYRKSINWFYNLEYDTNGLLKYLSFEDREEIAENNSVDYEDYRISIIPKKELKIGKINKDDKVKHPTFFYDLAQFYEFKHLKELASQTQYEKIDVEDISQIDVDKYLRDMDYHQLINDRVEYDCLIAKELADQFTLQIEQIVGINKYRSKASIARRYVLENLKHSLKMPNKQIIQSALNAYHAGHIEACKLGIFENIYNYDLNSAYPHNIANLYTTDGRFKHNQEYEPDTAYSFYLLNIDYYNDNLTPVWINSHQKNYHPNGKLDIWVTQPELEFFMNKGFDYKIKKAYHIMKSKDHEQPFKELVNELYEKRLEAKKDHDPIQLTYKIILNSIYGVTINTISKNEISEVETDNFKINKNGDMVFYKKTFKATNMYNPLFGAYITAQTRTTLFTDFYKHLDKLISVNTDGVYLTSKNNVKVSKKLGDYSLDKINKIMVLGSGRYFSFNKDGEVNNKESKFRSIPKSPSEIYNMMINNHTDHLSISRDKPIKLKESVKIKVYRERLNEFRNVTKNVFFKIDRRVWYDQFETIDDIFDKQIESRPFCVSELS